MIGHISLGSLRGKHLRSTVAPTVTLELLGRLVSQGFRDAPTPSRATSTRPQLGNLQNHQAKAPQPGLCPIQKTITGSSRRQALSTEKCNDRQRRSRGQGPPPTSRPSRQRTHGKNRPAVPPLPVQPLCLPTHPTSIASCLIQQCKGSFTITIETRNDPCRGIGNVPRQILSL